MHKLYKIHTGYSNTHAKTPNHTGKNSSVELRHSSEHLRRGSNPGRHLRTDSTLKNRKTLRSKNKREPSSSNSERVLTKNTQFRQASAPGRIGQDRQERQAPLSININTIRTQREDFL